jgi:hypothetical protein
MTDTYILNGKTPVPEPDLMAWGLWMTSANRQVARDHFGGSFVCGVQVPQVTVSTIFLGLDHGFGNQRPVLFETMIFGDPFDQEMSRYCTWEEAEIGHKASCERVKSAIETTQAILSTSGI